MSKRTWTCGLAGAALAAALVAAVAARETAPARPAPADPAPAADQPAGPPVAEVMPPAGVPEELRDEAFARFADVDLLAKAWARQDAGLMADAALGFVEGERVLFRSHKKGLPAARVVEYAAKVAASRGDKDALARVDRAAGLLKDAGLADRLAAARKLAEAPRDAGVAVDPEKTTPASLALYQDAVARAYAAAHTGDRAGLEAVKKLAESPCAEGKEDCLTAPQRQHLTRIADAGLKSAPAADKADPAGEVLRKLAASTRARCVVRNHSYSDMTVTIRHDRIRSTEEVYVRGGDQAYIDDLWCGHRTVYVRAAQTGRLVRTGHIFVDCHRSFITLHVPEIRVE